MEVLKQGQYSPVKIEHQVMIIFVASNNFLEDVPVDLIREFEREFYDFMDAQYPEVGKAIKTTGKLDEATEAKLRVAIDDFKEDFDGIIR